MQLTQNTVAAILAFSGLATAAPTSGSSSLITRDNIVFNGLKIICPEKRSFIECDENVCTACCGKQCQCIKRMLPAPGLWTP